jgi:antitoxin Phd
MKTWTLQGAKAGFCELLETCLRDGPQLITRNGEKAAVLVAAAQWQRLTSPSKPTLKDLLLADAGRFDMRIPARRKKRRDAAAPF